jgi:hypothetical protein
MPEKTAKTAKSTDARMNYDEYIKTYSTPREEADISDDPKATGESLANETLATFREILANTKA